MNTAAAGPSLSLDEVRATRAAIDPWIVRTPVHDWRGPELTARLGGPLNDRLAGKRVGVIACGANIDVATFARHVAGAPAAAAQRSAS
jgi:hypothetical protein